MIAGNRAPDRPPTDTLVKPDDEQERRRFLELFDSGTPFLRSSFPGIGSGWAVVVEWIPASDKQPTDYFGLARVDPPARAGRGGVLVP